MAMTWKELAKKISELTEEQQQTYVTVVDSILQEAFPVAPAIETANSEDYGLDENHPFIVVKRD